MSALKHEVNVSLAITFEYLEKSQPEAQEYKDSYLIWNSVGTPQYQNGSYSHKSSEWIVPRSGVLLHGMGHMHDGGTNVDLYINDKMVCSSRMYYNARPGYGSYLASPHGHSKAKRRNSFSRRDSPAKGVFGGKHISDPGHCTSFGRVEKGDRMHVKAYYNTKEYEVMNHKGKTEEQMGILRVFIGPDVEASPTIDSEEDEAGQTWNIEDDEASQMIISEDDEIGQLTNSELEDGDGQASVLS